MSLRFLRSFFVNLILGGCLSSLCSAQVDYTSPYLFTTLAGQIRDRDAVGDAASFHDPSGVAMDGAGNVYVADLGNHKIRKISPTGAVTTLAGTGNSGSAEGMGAGASFRFPERVAVSASGVVYVTDTYNNKVRKITADGVVTTLAGSGSGGFADGQETAAVFSLLAGITVDATGTIYVIDGNRIRKITAGGLVTTLAGSNVEGKADGSGVAATFGRPQGLAVDAEGTLYVADTNNHRIRKVSPAGVVTTLAGSNGSGAFDGTGNAASFSLPSGVAVDATGHVYVADTGNHKIRKITPAGVVTSLAGPIGYFPHGFAVAGYDDGTGNAARFNEPTDVVVDGAGNLYVSDRKNHRIRKVTAAGVVTTLAGEGSVSLVDGAAAVARFSSPTAVAVDTNETVYVVDSGNRILRKITAEGEVASLGGFGSENSGITVDTTGNVYFADSFGRRLRKMDASGQITTLAGTENPGNTDGTGQNARFQFIGGLGVDSAGNVYVADTGNHNIRKVTPTGTVSTLAGDGIAGYNDGPGAGARFRSPAGVAVDAVGNIYVADRANLCIRKITSSGQVSLLAGSFLEWGDADGPGSSARFESPAGVSVDAAGNVYVVDGTRCAIRKIRPDGRVSTLAGSSGPGGRDAVGADAGFYYPTGIAVGPTGILYVADEKNHRIRKGALAAPRFSGSLQRVATRNTAFAHALTVTGAPTHFEAVGLPAGLAIDPSTGVISGTPAVAGGFDATVSATNSGGTGSVSVRIFVTGSDYAVWAAAFFASEERSDALVGGPLADPDGDGIGNLLEFVLGGSPRAANVGILPEANVTGDGRNLIFSYVRKSAAFAVNQVIEYSNNPGGSWTPAVQGLDGVIVAIDGLEAETERVSAVIPLPEEGKLFVRLRVVP